jgi:hypothetical protein
MGISSYYFKNIEGKIIKHNYWDVHLTSDNQGCKVDYANTCNDGSNHEIVSDSLVLWFDTNQSGTTTDGSSLISLVEWTGTTIKPSSGFTLCDFGLTGVDNGRYDQLSGISVTITSADTRVILYPVTGYTINTISGTATSGLYEYPWTYRVSGTTTDGCDVGSTICLDGGFYQGYFKLDFLKPTPELETMTSTTCNSLVTTTTAVEGDDEAMIYDLMPTEFEDGWSMETWIKWDNSYCSSGSTGTTLNDDFTGNTGFFFYIGTRAENKFRNIFSGETNLTTCHGIPLVPDDNLVIDDGGESWFSTNNLGLPGCWCPCPSDSGTTSTTGTTYCDELSENALGFRVTPNGNIGYRKMTVTVGCYNNEERITGTTMEEGYSDTSVMYSGGAWNHVVVTFTQNSIKHGLPAGTLRFWVNGRVVYRVEDFIGLQLRALNEWSDKQLGVPFNISWGGGTQGLLESQTFGGPDPADDGLDLETNFAGTFEGELSQLRFYEKPLNILEIRNNMYVDCDRYCVSETYGGPQIVQPTSPFCENCN